jgi:hypothetical protein
MDESQIRADMARLTASLNFTFKFDADEDLVRLKKGRPLRVDELQQLPDGAVVFVKSVMWEDPRPQVRMNGACRITKREDDGDVYWDLNNGSSFGGEFRADEGTEVCVEEFPEGKTELFIAIDPERKDNCPACAAGVPARKR